MAPKVTPKVTPKSPKTIAPGVCLSRRETHIGGGLWGGLGNAPDSDPENVELTPRSELERTGWLLLAETAREVFQARLVHLETDRLSLGRPGDQARPGESEPVTVIW